MKNYLYISKTRLLVYIILSFGLYMHFWAWCNWTAVKLQTGRKISPFWRTVFLIFYIIPLINTLKESLLNDDDKNNQESFTTWANVYIFIFFGQIILFMFEYLNQTIPFSLKMYHDWGTQYNIISDLFRPVFLQIMLPSLKSSFSFIILLFDLLLSHIGVYYTIINAVIALLYAGSIWAMMSMQEIVNKYIAKNNKEEANYKVHIAEIIIIVLINPFILWCVVQL